MALFAGGAVTGGTFGSVDVTKLIATAVVFGDSGGQLIALNGGQAQVFDGPSVPEPASLGLLCAGLFSIGFVRRSKS